MPALILALLCLSTLLATLPFALRIRRNRRPKFVFKINVCRTGSLQRPIQPPLPPGPL
jgi:hypothetical protein